MVESIQTLSLPASLTPPLMHLTVEFSSLFPSAPLPTPYHLLLTSFVILLFRYTPDPSMVLCTSVPGTSTPILLKLDLTAEMTFYDVLRQVMEREEDAAADVLPISTLISHLKPEGPLYRVRFFDSTHIDADPSGSLTTDLTLFLLASDKQGQATRSAMPSLYLNLTYNSLLFTQSRIQSVLDSLLQLLRSASSADAAHPIGSLSLRTESQVGVLPDPSSDLDWCGFVGAIPDIFSANAKANPDRTCVVQCEQAEGQGILDGPSKGRRVFTYRQIDEASNVLAHSLVKNGLQPGEVVMVYAARSVDMVVCVMGILKAGGVFSVVGELLRGFRRPLTLRPRLPSYPPGRVPPGVDPPCAPCHLVGWRPLAHRLGLHQGEA